MKKRLYLIALITAPIIAIYGASPLYIFEVLTLKDFAQLSVKLMMHVLLVWAAQLYCISKFPKQRVWKRFAAAYVFSTLVPIFAHLLFSQATQEHSPALKYLAYPVINSFAVNTLVAVIANSVISSSRKIAAEQEVRQLILENSEAQKQVLMRQLQPHFLFNALSVLKSLISDDKVAAEDYVVKLSAFLRYSVQANKSDLATLAEEQAFTNDYLDLQRLRFHESFSCDRENIAAVMPLKLPVFALQTVVENAFKHNYFTAKAPLIIRISYADSNLIISNNKMAVRESETSGTGLKDLNERYRLITGKSITVIDTPDSFSVKLPLISA